VKKLSFSDNKKKQDKLLLVVDKFGIIGSAILDYIPEHNTGVSVVFATGNDAVSKRQENTHTIAYRKKLPMFPNGDYIAIVLVYNGEQEIIEAIGSFIKKTDETKGKCLLVVPWEYRQEKRILQTKEKNADLSVIYVGELFGKKYFDTKTTIGRFFKEAQIGNQLVVSGVGMTSTYPVYLEDVAGGIVQVALENIKGKLFFLFPQFPPTKLGLARMFQKIDPLLKIDLTKEKKETPQDPVVLDAVYLLPSSYMLEPKIREVYMLLGDGEEKKEKHTPQILEQKEKKHWGAFILFVFLIACYLLLMPIFTTLLFSFVGAKTLKEGESFLLAHKIIQAQKKAEDAKTLFTIALKTSDALVYEASFINQALRATIIRNTVVAGAKTSDALLAASKIDMAIEKTDGAAVGSLLRFFLASLDDASMEKGSVVMPSLSLDSIKNTAEVLPEVLGFNSPKTYLVLFQNNMELRPGGGFIGSFAVAKVKNGKVDFTINNVYDADGQLKGHVEPPFAIRRYLPSAHWYLRDSNFSIDFPSSASTSAFFLQKETGQQVDGVIAVDVSFVRSLVGVVGPITIPDYNETVTGDNFYQLVEKHAQDNSFPGSTQKKDFLSAVFVALQNKITSGGISYSQLLKAVQNRIDEKHILFAFANPSIQNVFAVTNMSSSAQALDLQSTLIGIGESKIKDFLGISEANLGVNKANYKVARKVKQDVTISKEGSVVGKLAITYSNTGKDDYKNYLRIIFPRGTKISAVAVNGALQTVIPAVTDPKIYESKQFTAPKGLEIEQGEEENKTIFGILVTIPKQGTTTVSMSYDLVQKFNADSKSIFYELWYFKQPGTDAYPYEFDLSYPDSLKPLNVGQGEKANMSQLIFSQNLTTDKQFVIHFSKE